MVNEGTARTSDGASLSWTSRGSGEPILLIAGQAVTQTSWNAFADGLSDQFTVITFDQRGIGSSSDGATPPTTTRAIARDALSVMDSLKINRFHLIGHSMGGRVAQWLALDSTDAVGTLVLIATTGGDERGFPRPAAATTDLASGDRERLASRFFSEAFLGENPYAIDVFVRPEGSPRSAVEPSRQALPTTHGMRSAESPHPRSSSMAERTRSLLSRTAVP